MTTSPSRFVALRCVLFAWCLVRTTKQALLCFLVFVVVEQVSKPMRTVQLDLSSKIDIQFAKREDFKSIIWAHVDDLSLSFADDGKTCAVLVTCFNSFAVTRIPSHRTITAHVI